MFSPIAIVGRACVLPGALSPEQLWEAVSEGRDLVRSAPDGRWRAPASDVLCTPKEPSDNRSWSDRGGYVRGFERIWDPTGFAVPAHDLDDLDPLFLWALHCARAALADAGDDRSGDVNRSRVSATFGNLGFPSAGMTRYAEALWQGEQTLPDARNRFMASGAAELVREALQQKRTRPASRRSTGWTLSAKEARRGIIYAEILGKPKAVRREGTRVGLSQT